MTALPALRIAVTRTVIVAGALATRDFEDVHHDPARAVERGTPDIFLSINTTNGFVVRYVTDWAGPDARVLGLKTRLGVPAFPGDTLTFTGSCAADGTTVTVRGTTARGVHVTSVVTVRR
jgi:hypothetical protein